MGMLHPPMEKSTGIVNALEVSSMSEEDLTSDALTTSCGAFHALTLLEIFRPESTSHGPFHGNL